MQCKKITYTLRKVNCLQSPQVVSKVNLFRLKKNFKTYLLFDRGFIRKHIGGGSGCIYSRDASLSAALVIRGEARRSFGDFSFSSFSFTQAQLHTKNSPLPPIKWRP